MLNCSERSAGSHGLDRSKSRPDCPVTWLNRRKIGRLGRKGSRKPVHPVRGVSVLGLESLSFKLNFGTIRIDWERDDPQLLLQIADIDGSAVFEKTVKLSQLQFPD